MPILGDWRTESPTLRYPVRVDQQYIGWAVIDEASRIIANVARRDWAETIRDALNKNAPGCAACGGYWNEGHSSKERPCKGRKSDD